MTQRSDRKNSSAALAAFLILFGTGIAFYFLPRAMNLLGALSPWIAGGFGALLVLCFFLLFWLRARYQRRRESGKEMDRG